MSYRSGYSDRSSISGFILLISALIFTFVGVLRFINYVQFKNGCGGRLERAANANTVEIAAKELDAAIKYLDYNNLKFGYTSIIYNTPDEDIEFWYNNIVACAKELKELSANSTQLEKTNVLMKLRESLLNETGAVTIPLGIEIYPSNGLYAFFLIVSGVVIVISGFIWIEHL